MHFDAVAKTQRHLQELQMLQPLMGAELQRLRDSYRYLIEEGESHELVHALNEGLESHDVEAVAHRCRALMRDYDMIARLGGEEFSAMLPYATAEEGAAIAERLRAAIAAEPIEGIDVRTSIGGTALRDTDGTLDEVLERADQALYAAKRGGRNRVVFA